MIQRLSNYWNEPVVTGINTIRINDSCSKRPPCLHVPPLLEVIINHSFKVLQRSKASEYQLPVVLTGPTITETEARQDSVDAFTVSNSDLLA